MLVDNYINYLREELSLPDIHPHAPGAWGGRRYYYIQQ